MLYRDNTAAAAAAATTTNKQTNKQTNLIAEPSNLHLDTRDQILDHHLKSHYC